MTHIAFLHTSATHIPTFQTLLDTLAPGIAVEHFVDATLLADARTQGLDEPSLVRRIHAAMRTAAGSGASLVVCTCSTIGGVAETCDTQGRYTATRIDRATADRAVELGPAVLVVAAVESTLRPTETLIRDAAHRAALPVSIRCALIPGAWSCFESGDLDRYIQRIADGVRAVADGVQVVVLAQASMAPAAALLGDLGIAVLSSPELGVRAALEMVSRPLPEAGLPK